MFVYADVSDLSVLRASRTSPGRELMACLLLICFPGVDQHQRGNLCSPHFSEVSAFSQIREALRRLLSASVESQRSFA